MNNVWKMLIVIGLIAMAGLVSAAKMNTNSGNSILEQLVEQIQEIMDRLTKVEEKLNYESRFWRINDTPIGHSQGWNPGNGEQFYTIKDKSVHPYSVIAITIDGGTVNCHTRKLIPYEGFKIHCGEGLADGASINYEIRTPIIN